MFCVVMIVIKMFRYNMHWLWYGWLCL